MKTTPDPRAVALAMELLQLGVSGAGVVELLLYDHDRIERQLAYLPYRKAKRPSAFIMDAIRQDYSPPNTYPHASSQNEPVQSPPRVDTDSQSAPGSTAPNPERH